MTKFRRKKFNKLEKGFLQKAKTNKINLNDSGLKILLLCLIIFVGISYLYFINLTATGGFDIKGIENNIEMIDKENKNLEVKAAEMQSLAKIEEASRELNMEVISYIEYLPAVGSTVAVR